MWRHADIWRTLGGGIDFVTLEPLEGEWSQSQQAVDGGVVRLCTAPLIHGAAMVALLAALFVGDTVVLMPRFDTAKVWQAVERHQVNIMMLIGDAMGRPLIEEFRRGGYDASSVISVNSTAALFSPVVKEAWTAALPNALLNEAIGATETGFLGLGFLGRGFLGRGFRWPVFIRPGIIGPAALLSQRLAGRRRREHGAGLAAAGRPEMART